ncbi:hypothetical protein [Actinoplanes sp. NPDC051851]|uniref:hypothetical protein n=1 Tax=Actinoplanes sp. NPDC051851 TaxID=3154753 RepID=UPI003423567F
MELIVAGLQAAGAPGDVAANRAQLRDAAREAAAAGAGLLITTELFQQTLEYVGRSSIVAPSGAVLAGAVHGDHLLLATVDTGVVARDRAANPYLTDRRPDLY